MPGDGVKDVEGVAYGADVDSGEGGLLVHGRRSWRGGVEGVVGGNGRITEVVINEFRVFPDWSPLRFDVNTKKGKSHQEWK